MRKLCRYMAIVALLFGAACMGGNQKSQGNLHDEEVSTGLCLSERETRLYTATLRKVEAAEQAFQSGEESLAKVLSDVRKLQYPYNDEGMNDETRQYCEALQYRIDTLKEYAKRLGIESATVGGEHRQVAMGNGQPRIIEGMERKPYYLCAGDVLHYSAKSEKGVAVSIYNAESYSRLKSHSGREIKDSLKVEFSAIYLVEVISKERQYVTTEVSVACDSHSHYRPEVMIQQEQCQKGDFGAVAVETIKMINIFDEPRQFTLRGQIKSTFSGTSRALVPIAVPAGATDILYSMRISTSEMPIDADGEFYENLGHSYRRIDVLKLPVYESTRRSGIMEMILDDNRPIREEDAYCSLYVVRSQSEAKGYQDGTLSAAAMNYDVDNSSLGTQSCNGRIPVDGSKTIYLAFENDRMRYTNYLWVEAVAVTPTTEYYRNVYSIR